MDVLREIPMRVYAGKRDEVVRVDDFERDSLFDSALA